ncbi:MAG: hypothetical protein OXI24_02635, partial [Candidatus Poribacteria bacterium]|nr:hypothetical protein [Candidatus Poribacteria bacterium]
MFQTEEIAGRAAIGVPAPKAVSIPDTNLAKAVRKALGLQTNARITNQHMLKLSVLDAKNSQIKNLTGLEHATHLTRLNLDRNQIRNLNPLSGLTRLKTLTLDENQISNVRPLTGLTQLEWLLIGGNPIKNAGVRLLKQCFTSRVIAHELGHAFGLGHDFRADAYVMSYGVFLDPLESRETARVEPHRLSDSAAEWLDVHTAFNRRPINKIDTPSQITLLSQRLISP